VVDDEVAGGQARAHVIRVDQVQAVPQGLGHARIRPDGGVAVVVIDSLGDAGGNRSVRLRGPENKKAGGYPAFFA
jgi:hypothetical protein